MSRRRDSHDGKFHFGKFAWLLLILALAGFLTWWSIPRTSATQLNYGKLIQLLDNPRVHFKEVEVTPTEIRGRLVRPDGTEVPFVTSRRGLENDPNLVPLLRKKVGAALKGQPARSSLKLIGKAMIAPLLTTLFFGAVLFWLLRRLTGGSLLTFGRSNAQACVPESLNTTFRDVAGVDEVVAELREIVDFLKSPQQIQALGGHIPKGVLLIGPPGTGKTLLARAIAGEAHVPFFSRSGSDFVEMFVGVGAARIRDLFARAERQAPCIIFLDELDALGKRRGLNPSGSHDEREQTLNQLLVEMDGFKNDRGVIIMAATNCPETLDPALLRPGRFDRTIVVDRPDINGREAILKVHASQVKLAGDVNLRNIAALTPGFVGADLANLMNEAALLAARRGSTEVQTSDLEEAIERGVAGLERKRRVMRLEERQRIAYHEAGHALVASTVPQADPVHKVSIIPRGVAALGYTLQRPEDDRYLTTQSELHNRIKVLLGGVAAEELVYGEISTGAQNDLDNASRIARSMVTQFGMSRLGRVSYQGLENAPFLRDQPPAIDRPYSEQTARQIDKEIRRLIDGAAAEVRALLAERRTALEAVARRLLEKEVLDAQELQAILQRFLPPKVPAAAFTGFRF
jgi:cell division protease FtsH